MGFFYPQPLKEIHVYDWLVGYWSIVQHPVREFFIPMETSPLLALDCMETSEKEGIFITPLGLKFPDLSERPPHFVAFCDSLRILRMFCI
jgi:hypothetical protein